MYTEGTAFSLSNKRVLYPNRTAIWLSKLSWWKCLAHSLELANIPESSKWMNSNHRCRSNGFIGKLNRVVWVAEQPSTHLFLLMFVYSISSLVESLVRLVYSDQWCCQMRRWYVIRPAHEGGYSHQLMNYATLHLRVIDRHLSIILFSCIIKYSSPAPSRRSRLFGWIN